MGKMGCGFLILLAIFVLIFGGNEVLGEYLENCSIEENVFECLSQMTEEEPKPEGTVTATGTYTYNDYSVDVTANIPLEGGAVTGSISGTCSGKVKGNYNNQTGVISGAMSGACSPFIVNVPASAEYAGTVNKSAKTVPISFTGKGAGITHEGSMSLSY